MTTTAYRTCPLCEAACGLTLTLNDHNRVTSVRGDNQDPFSQGFLCPKGASLGQLDEDPDRLTTPLVRKGDQWREVGWDEAFRVVEAGIREVIDTHGRQALALYFGNPTYHTMAGFMYRQALTEISGTRNIYSAATADQMPKHVSCGLMFGDPFAVAVPDLDRTDYLLVLGANPMVSNGSLCVAPDFPRRLKDLRKRGGKLVVIDPRRTRTAEVADEHNFIQPGTDPFLLFGIVNTLFTEHLVKAGDTVSGVEVAGIEELRRMAEEFPSELVAPICKVPAETIRRLARELSSAPTAAVYARIGTCTAEFGTLAQWLVDAINVLTGNFDKAGGVMFAKTAALEIFRTGQPFSTGKFRSRVRGLPEVNGELPVATLADEIETPGEGQVRALLAIAGNPVLSAPNGPRLDPALANLDMMVCVDPYLNETTKHADVILPPPRMLQSAHWDFLVQIIMVRNYARYSEPVLPLRPDQYHEHDILARLFLILAGMGADTGADTAHEMVVGQLLEGLTSAPGSPVAGTDPAELRAGLEGTGPDLFLDALLKFGGYGLTLDSVRKQPHGIDLGPLQPRFHELVCTASGKLELAPAALVDDVERLRARMKRPSPELVLIGRRHLRSNNSWLHNVPALVGGSNRCTLQINPADVARYGLGAHALIRSATGELEVTLEPVDSIMPGVVSLPHGWGHDGTTQSVAAKEPGVNVNTLTGDTAVDTPSGNAILNGVPVTISPLLTE
ncbi:anaerobic dehydrogenase, typically selenocysteine-containing [Saccharomonospora marina XMU15]|uniref:Anaerobic dehydrogenase, typically selenocysteine-containing n=1 Tax=Saccharomonospora marina XMU15 TaxID=882083 RepID=H5XBX3_9PSEU|nr:molybdopterin oxidoreductase family protein [Saccharomonospora marina]EHR52760.1 anaerobic dehydrogenase, typically selenocysteine-containing [Saccharomonospora marina XMU15]